MLFRSDAIARRFRQPVGMAVMEVDQGWIAAVDGDGVYPQQSVSKLWVAISVLDAVDQFTGSWAIWLSRNPISSLRANQESLTRVVDGGSRSSRWSATPRRRPAGTAR